MSTETLYSDVFNNSLGDAFRVAGIKPNMFKKARPGRALCLLLGGKYNVPCWIAVEASNGPDAVSVLTQRAELGNDFNLNYVTARTFEGAREQVVAKLDAWLKEGNQGRGTLYQYRTFEHR